MAIPPRSKVSGTKVSGTTGTVARSEKERAVALNTEKEEPRHWIADWTVTVLLLLFGTTTLLQAFVVPTGSMTNTVLIGDHMIVDKLAYSPAGSISKYILPYREPKRGDIIVFRYPVDINAMYV